VVAFLAACGSDSSTSAGDAGTSSATSGSTTGATTGSTVGDDGTCTAIPEETAGPYPGDGSNGPNVLDLDDVVRADLRTSFGGLEGSVDGVECTIALTVLDAATCAPIEGAAVYAWHCDAEGRYSLYSDGVTDQNWLRGVQVSDADGVVRFTTIVAGCYPGRWPHVHFEIYDDLASATSSGTPRATSQLAFPQATCEAVYADSRYPGSDSNLAQLSLAGDNVFGDDGGIHQIATITGSVSEGIVAMLAAPV
jgi:protocatechuate 3,4-dioxygenase beta subunit